MWGPFRSAVLPYCCIATPRQDSGRRGDHQRAPRPQRLSSSCALRLQRLADDPAPRGVALGQRLREVLGLLELDVRRQRRDLGVDDRLDDAPGRSAASARSHAGATWSGRVDADALEARAARRSGRTGSRGWLRGGELRIARQHALLPGHLVEVAVVEHEHDEARVAPAVAVLGHVDQRVDPVHLHRPVALDRDHRAGRGGRTWPRARRAAPGPSWPASPTARRASRGGSAGGARTSSCPSRSRR